MTAVVAAASVGGVVGGCPRACIFQPRGSQVVSGAQHKVRLAVGAVCFLGHHLRDSGLVVAIGVPARSVSRGLSAWRAQVANFSGRPATPVPR